MIFYGKAQRRVAVAAALAEIEGWIAEALAAPLPIERHAGWTAALVEAGGLAQGLADARDGAVPAGVAPEGAAPEGAAPEGAAMALCFALATAMGRSWDSAFSDQPRALPGPVAAALAALRAAADGTATIEIRRAEGFAHYAVYPEAHWRAASALAAPRPTRVVGLRSIGTALSAAVAAALDAPPPRTVRPHGHPFARAVALAPPLDAVERDAVWAIVDEGPGLSGSSIGATADALAAAGVTANRLVLLPGHAGPPGREASEAHRRLWAAARQAVVPVEHLILDRARGLAAWVADLTGPALSPPEDLAGGAWRGRLIADAADWPAVDRQNERRKYLLPTGRGPVLLRFAGLGRLGRDKLARAEALAEAGFGIRPLGLRHGFLVEPWRSDLRPLAPGAFARPAPLGRLADYLAFRARAFPAAQGAGLDALLAMARANAAEALGEAEAARLDAWAEGLPALARRARPVAIDGRLAAHEWLGDGGDRPLKADALDHCCGHDLVGCQDIAWDVAGAAAEHALSDAEAEALRAGVERRSGLPCDAGLVSLFRIAYPAFALGALSLALGRESGEEAERLAAARARQVASLRLALARDAAAAVRRGPA